MSTEQETFWREQYSAEYRAKNAKFDQELGARGWREMLKRAEGIETILECGSNIGRNIGFLNAVLPAARKTIIELSPEAYRIAREAHDVAQGFNGPILDSQFSPASFDLVFTCGVLIHIHPDHLAANMGKMFEYSRRYVLIGEYFSRTPVMLEYQGQADKLFKRDFGQYFLQHFPAKLVDYGFLWGHLYDAAGFDDITWWLFEKQA